MWPTQQEIIFHPHDSKWIIDSGASRHLCGNSLFFSDLKAITAHRGVSLADGSSSPVIGQGNVSISSSLQLKNVLHAPSFPQSLLSVSCLTKELNCRVIFDPVCCHFQDLLTGKKIGGGYEENGVYYLHHPVGNIYAAVDSSRVLFSGIVVLDILHCRSFVMSFLKFRLLHHFSVKHVSWASIIGVRFLLVRVSPVIRSLNFFMQMYGVLVRFLPGLNVVIILLLLMIFLSCLGCS